MNKKRFSFPVTSLIMILILAAGFVLQESILYLFDLPEWSTAMIMPTFFIFVYEFPSKFGPKEFETYMSFLWRADRNDKFVFISAVILFNFSFVIEGLFFKGQKNGWFLLALLLVNLLVVSLEVWMLSSKKFKEEFLNNFKRKPPSSQ